MHGCRGVFMVAGGRAWLQGTCMVLGGVHGCRGACVAGGSAWLWGVHGCGGHARLWQSMAVGGMHGCRGVSMVAGVCMAGGHVRLPEGGHGCRGACIGYDVIRSMSRRYASYWNAFLFNIIFLP